MDTVEPSLVQWLNVYPVFAVAVKVTDDPSGTCPLV